MGLSKLPFASSMRKQIHKLHDTFYRWAHLHCWTLLNYLISSRLSGQLKLKLTTYLRYWKCIDITSSNRLPLLFSDHFFSCLSWPNSRNSSFEEWNDELKFPWLTCLNCKLIVEFLQEHKWCFFTRKN